MALASEEHISKVIDSMLNDWVVIAKIFHLIVKSDWCRRVEDSGLASVKTFTWNKLVLSYGPIKAAVLSITYSILEKCYKLSFGTNN